MELALKLKDRVMSKATFKAISYTICLATLYYSLSLMTMGMSANAQMLAGASTFKVANLLRAFVLVSPFAVIGTSIGAWMFNLTTGFATVGAYPVIPIAVAGFGILMHKVSQFVGRSVIKDLSVLFVFGVLVSTVVYSNLLMMIAAVGVITSPLVKVALTKIVLHGLTVMAGYPFIKTFETVAKKIKEN